MENSDRNAGVIWSFMPIGGGEGDDIKGSTEIGVKYFALFCLLDGHTAVAWPSIGS